MNAQSRSDQDAATLKRRLQIKAYIALINEQLHRQHGNLIGINARVLLVQFDSSEIGQLTSPPGTDGHAVGLTMFGVKGRATSEGAIATLKLWREAATDALAIL